MVTGVKLKNFKSFGDIEFDFKKSKNKVKNFAAIYGENGSGKTNFIESIRMLIMSILSYREYCTLPDVRDMILHETDIDKNNKRILDILNFRLQSYNLVELLQKCRMTDCDDPTSVEYSFRYKGEDDKEHEASYELVFKDHIIKEELRCWTGKQTGIMFRLIEGPEESIDQKINNDMIKNKQLAKEINEKINKFWGGFTLLSFIYDSLISHNRKYTNESYSVHFRNVFTAFTNINVLTRSSAVTSRLYRKKSVDMLFELAEGITSQKNLGMLLRSEKIVCEILTQTYSDIKKAEYIVEEQSDKTIHYVLMIDKMIAGKLRRISIKDESFGTNQLLNVLTPLVSAINGMTVFIDEVDTGIHDILCRNIIDVIRENTTGQLVITTHNTALLKHIDHSEAYIINIDSEGNKEAVCLSDFCLQKSNNPSQLYMSGKFGGVPVMDPIDSDIAFEALHMTDDELKQHLKIKREITPSEYDEGVDNDE